MITTQKVPTRVGPGPGSLCCVVKGSSRVEVATIKLLQQIDGLVYRYAIQRLGGIPLEHPIERVGNYMEFIAQQSASLT